MARYRKIDPRIWNDAKFRALTDSGKLAFLFVLTHPHMTAVGAMRATVAGLAAELGWSAEAFREAFREALSKGLVKHDEKACFVWLPNFLRYNAPESPNVVKAWAGAFDLLPECDLKFSLLQTLKAFTEALPKGFAEAFAHAFREAFAKGMPYPEQEPEQEQEQEEEGARVGRNRKAPTTRFDPLTLSPLPEWAEWIDRRRKRKWPIDETTLRKQLAVLAPHPPATQAEILNTSIQAGWQGLFPPKGATTDGRRKTRYEQADEALEQWRAEQRGPSGGFLEGDEGALRLPLDGSARGSPVTVVDAGDRVAHADGGEAGAALADDERDGASPHAA